MSNNAYPEFKPLPNGFVKDVVGYADKISVYPNEQLAFKLGSYQPGEASAAIVKLISGDDRPHGTGLIEEHVAALGTQLEIPYQPLITGSYASVAGLPQVLSGSLELWVYPTLPESDATTVVNMAGVLLQVNSTGFQLVADGVQEQILCAMEASRWYQVIVKFGENAEIQVRKLSGGTAEPHREIHHVLNKALTLPDGEWCFAATERGVQHFNGRIENPLLKAQGQVVAQWDFAQEMASQTVVDVTNAHHGTLHQTPTRAVCGHLWDASVQCYTEQHEHYGAIHFHDDDITDALWDTTLSWQVPSKLKSGQYALKIDYVNAAGEASDEYIPFYVKSKPGESSSNVLYLAPTATYLAYANQRIGISEGIFGNPNFKQANDAFLATHPELGDSLYEYHRDGSGVHFSSRLRPVLNLKPKNTTWAFNADTHLTAWLNAIEQTYDIITDEDLHLQGVASLADYDVVITGTHPEYYSTQMRQALEQHLADNGRLMYMGGNGFYWRVAFQPENPAVMEVRRAEDGTRAWIAEPGEYYQQFNGEYGGLWRRLGKPPNELVGIGFAAQGFDGGTYYRVEPGALDPRVSFIVEGVDSSDIWGDFGNQGGGAAGEEIDRHDISLGSPAHAVVLATSENHRPGMLRVKEEFHMMEPLGNDKKVRADMTFFEVPGGGAVFSTGSISYSGSLAHNNYDNNIAQLTLNVLNRFKNKQPFEYPH